MTFATSSPPALGSTLGALVIGIIISIGLFGVMCVQAFTYYQADFKDDHAHVKILVAWVCIVETVHTVFLCLYLYEACVRYFGDYIFLPKSYWSLIYSIPVATFVSAPVQIFFAFRVYTLSKRLVYLTISTFGSIGRLALTLTLAVLAERTKNISLSAEKYFGAAATALSVGAAVDIGNTLSLCYYLAKSKSDVPRSKKVIDTLIVWAIETGLLTSICMVTAVILLSTMRNNTIWVSPVTFSAKLYSNSLLASLNGRTSLREVLWSSRISMNGDVQRTRETNIRFNVPGGTTDVSSMALPESNISSQKAENEKLEV